MAMFAIDSLIVVLEFCCIDRLVFHGSFIIYKNQIGSLRAPSNLMTSPLSIGFIKILTTSLPNSSGWPNLLGQGTSLLRSLTASMGKSSIIWVLNIPGATAITLIPWGARKSWASSSLAVHSAYRFVQRAAANKIPIAILNVEEALATVNGLDVLKILAPAGPSLGQLIEAFESEQKKY